MVSFFSLFTGKKRRKSTARPSSPNGETPRRNARTSSPTRQRSSTRFFSLRSRNARPYDVQQRQSAEAKRRRSIGTAVANPEDEAPRLTLGWEGRARTTELQTKEGFLGLDGVGRPPKLSDTEVKVVREQRWSCEEVMQGWKWFGASLRDSNLEWTGIMLPLRMGQDIQTRDLLLALFSLSVRPKLSSSFPSLTDHYPTASEERSEATEDQNTWTERLLQSLKELGNPADIAEALKFLLRRLSPSPVLPHSLDPSSPLKPFLTDEVYAAFVHGEQKSSYNLQSYELIFLPRLRLGVGAYLEEIFEVWGAIASRGEVNMMGGGRLPLLLGWWIWGHGARDEAKTWAELYKEWQVSGCKVEHLFYAWIRNQSTRQKLPTRLLELVDRYPFGDQSKGDAAPRPPPSTFPQQTLHVALQSTTPITRNLLPFDLLQQSFKAKIPGDINVSHFQALRYTLSESGAEDKHSQSVSEILAEDSQVFFKELSNGLPADQKTAAKSNGSLPSLPVSHGAINSSLSPANDQPLYRPFSMVSQHDLSSRIARRRSQSLSESGLQQAAVTQVSPLQALSEEVDSLINGSPRIKKRPSESNIRSLSNGLGNGGWESFEKSGFGNSPEPNLELSPQSTSLALSPEGNGSISAGFEKIDLPRRKSIPVPPIDMPPVVTGEEVIEVDDLFIAFAEDAQLDPTSKWPHFSLVRLASPIFRDDATPIEWLLITLEYQGPPEPAPVEAPSKRSISPGAMSTSSKFGSSFNLFRRTSSSMSIRNGGRRSIFGSTHRQEPKHSRSATNLAPLPESQSIPLKDETDRPLPGFAVSTAPTEYTITEVGDMVKLPIATDDAPEHFDPSGDTKPKDWTYRTEGGAHIIFAYRGTSPTYANRILRVRKTVTTPVPDEEIRTVWARDLLPKLLSRDLLLRITPVALEQRWLMDMLKAELPKRPRERQDSNSNESLLQSPEKVTAAWIMDDVLGKSRKDETVLCIEIKPKWGSLPSARHVQPAEAAQIKSSVPRFQLHEHHRDPASAHSEKYNPLDLYSGEQLRMRKALEGLWAVWESSQGEKNNWRINVDGKIILPDKSSIIPIIGMKGPARDSTIDALLPCLISSDVFTLVGNLQSHLDATDVSDLASRYKAAYPEFDIFDPANTPEPTTAEIDSFIIKYLEDPDAGATEHGWSFRERLIAFALAATFKDCSIMVRLPLAKSSGTWQLSSNPVVKVVDTDLKPLGSLRKWYDLDERLWRHWHKNPPQETTGTEATARGSDVSTEPLVRSKAFISPSVVEGSSVRALYSPTPDRSTPGTPKEPQVEELAELPDMAARTTTSKAVGVSLAPVITSAERAATTPAIDRDAGQAEPSVVVEPTTPVHLSSHDAKRGSEAVSLADALAITPSTTHFALAGRTRGEDDEDVVRSLQGIPIEEESPSVPHRRSRDLGPVTNQAPLSSLLESSPAKQEDVSPALPHEDQQVVPAAVSERPYTVVPTPEPAESISGSPVIQRTVRSLAPSPSPYPEFEESPVMQPTTLSESATHNDHFIPPNQVSISDPASPPEPIETSRDVEPLLEPNADEKSAEDDATFETSTSRDNYKNVEGTGTSQRGILGMAGTAAAVSAAAVVGAFGAVVGVTAAAVEVASPTKSTENDEEASKVSAKLVEDELVTFSAKRMEESAPLSRNPLSQNGAGLNDRVGGPEPPAEGHAPASVPVHYQGASVEAPLDQENHADLEQQQSTTGHAENAATPLIDQAEVAPRMPGGSELLDDATPQSVEEAQSVPEPAQERASALVAEPTADPVPQSIPSAVDPNLPRAPTPVPARQDEPSIPMADVGATDQVTKASPFAPVELDEELQMDQGVPFPTAETPIQTQADDNVANDSDGGSPKAVKRSTFGQVEEETAMDLAQVQGGPLDSETSVADEPTELGENTEFTQEQRSEGASTNVQAAPVAVPQVHQTEHHTFEEQGRGVLHGTVEHEDHAVGSEAKDVSPALTEQPDNSHYEENLPAGFEASPSGDLSPMNQDEETAPIEQYEEIPVPSGPETPGHSEEDDTVERYAIDNPPDAVTVGETLPSEPIEQAEQVPAVTPTVAAFVAETAPAPTEAIETPEDIHVGEEGLATPTVEADGPAYVPRTHEEHEERTEIPATPILDQGHESRSPQPIDPTATTSDTPAAIPAATTPHQVEPAPVDSPVADRLPLSIASNQLQETHQISVQPQGTTEEITGTAAEPEISTSTVGDGQQPSSTAVPVTSTTLGTLGHLADHEITEDVLPSPSSLEGHKDDHPTTSSSDMLSESALRATVETGGTAGYTGLEQQMATESGAAHDAPHYVNLPVESAAAESGSKSGDVANDSALGVSQEPSPRFVKPDRGIDETVTPVTALEPAESFPHHQQSFEPTPHPNPTALEDETPYMTPGSMVPTEEYPFDRDVPSRMSSVATDTFETPMAELDTPRFGPQSIRNDDIADLPQPSDEQERSAGEESFASDRTFGEDSVSSHRFAHDETDPTPVEQPDDYPVQLPGVPSGLPTTASNQFLRSQEAQVENLYPVDSQAPSEHDDQPLARYDDVDAQIPATPPVKPSLTQYHDQQHQPPP